MDITSLLQFVGPAGLGLMRPVRLPLLLLLLLLGLQCGGGSESGSGAEPGSGSNDAGSGSGDPPVKPCMKLTPCLLERIVPACPRCHAVFGSVLSSTPCMH